MCYSCNFSSCKSQPIKATDVHYKQNSIQYLKVVECIKKSHFKKGEHIEQREIERSISHPDILHALKHGWHESRHDRWNPEYKRWNFSIRGKTIGGKDLRVIVGLNLDETKLIIITAYDFELAPSRRAADKSATPVKIPRPSQGSLPHEYLPTVGTASLLNWLDCSSSQPKKRSDVQSRKA